MSKVFAFSEYFLPLIIAFGFISSYEDICEGKIKNKYVLLAIGFGLVLHSYLLFTNKINYSYLGTYLLNISIAAILAFILYFIGFWSAGDGKMLISYVFIIPLTIYSGIGSAAFSLAALLVNTFLPYFLISAVYVFINDLTLHKKELDDKTKIKDTLSNLLYVFSITWLTELIINQLKFIPSGTATLALSSAVVVYIIEKLRTLGIISWVYSNTRSSVLKMVFFGLKKVKITEEIIMGTISVIRIIFDYKNIFSFGFVFQFVIFYFVLVLIKNYIRNATVSFFTKKVHVLNLVRGNIIQDKIGLIKEKEKKEKYQIITKADLKHMMDSEFSGPLSDEDVKKIAKEYKLKKFGFDRVTIENSIPFAPVMFFGVIITILTNGALILLVSI